VGFDDSQIKIATDSAYPTILNADLFGAPF